VNVKSRNGQAKIGLKHTSNGEKSRRSRTGPYIELSSDISSSSSSPSSSSQSLADIMSLLLSSVDIATSVMSFCENRTQA
jgi:hypothetical protein